MENEDEWTPLRLAARYGHPETVKALLEGLETGQRLALLKMTTKNGSTPLLIAARHGHAETVKALLERLEPEQRFELLEMKDKDDWLLYSTASQAARQSAPAKTYPSHWSRCLYPL